jgi:cold shock CspA family protein
MKWFDADKGLGSWPTTRAARVFVHAWRRRRNHLKPGVRVEFGFDDGVAARWRCRSGCWNRCPLSPRPPEAAEDMSVIVEDLINCCGVGITLRRGRYRSGRRPEGGDPARAGTRPGGLTVRRVLRGLTGSGARDPAVVAFRSGWG